MRKRRTKEKTRRGGCQVPTIQLPNHPKSKSKSKIIEDGKTQRLKVVKII